MADYVKNQNGTYFDPETDEPLYLIPSQSEQQRQLQEFSPGIEENEYSGFYYDIQLNDPRTRVSLHPNTAVEEYVKNIDKNKTAKMIPRWSPIRSNGTAHRCLRNGKGSTDYLMIFHPESERDQASAEHPKGMAEDGKTEIDLYFPYARESICNSILAENFKIGVTNTFSDMGGDPISQLFNQNKASLPLMTEASKFISNIKKQTEDKKKTLSESGQLTKGKDGESWLDGLEGFLKGLEGAGKLQSTLLNRALVTQGARFSFYGGTAVNPENLTMTFTIFPSWKSPSTSGLPQFVTVYDQLEIIMPYVIGDFVPISFGGWKGSASDSKLVSVLKDIGNTCNSVLSEFCSWQLPPGGFEAYPKDVDIVQKGTLKLRVGTLFAIDNLVITSCNFSMSKEMVKHPYVNWITEEDYLTPAYCDVTLALKPITKYSKTSLLRFLRGEANSTDKFEVAGRMLRGMRAARAKLGRPNPEGDFYFTFTPDKDKNNRYYTTIEEKEEPKPKEKKGNKPKEDKKEDNK